MITPPPAPIGRDRELAALRDALASALAGRGSLVLVGGEAGIGKTTLAEAAGVEAEQRGALVLVGRCYDLAETPPYGPWREALARAPSGDELPALPMALLHSERDDGAALVGQDAIFRRVEVFLTALAARAPLVLLLDDLHWADLASLDLLRVVARGLVDAPLLLLATYRAEELTRHHPLYQLLPILVREARAIRLDLRPLDQEALLALVRARYALPADAATRLASYLAGRAEGNPLFTGELLRTIEETGTLARDNDGWALGDLVTVGVPPLLRQVIDARVDRLGEDRRDLLALAAAIGQEVPLALWATLGGTAEEVLLDTVERAIEARLLELHDNGGAARFAYAPIREAIYAGTLPSRRRAWHRRIGEALAAATSPDPDAVAYHFQRAGDARAAEWLVLAGERAHRAYAWVSAAERLKAAVAILEARGGAVREQGWLLYRLAKLLNVSDPAQGMHYLDEAQAIATSCSDRVLAACIRHSRGILRCHLLNIRAGLADIAASIAALDMLPDPDRATLAATSITWVAHTLPPTVRDAPVGAGLRDSWLGTYVLWLGGVGRHVEALALGTEVVARTAAADAADLLGFTACTDAHFGLGFVHAAAGRPEEARAAFQWARRQNRSIENHQGVSANTNREIDCVVLPYQADQLAERRALMADAASANALAGGVVGRATDQQPHLPFLVLEGRWDEARALDIGGMYHRNWLGFLAHARGDVMLARQAVQGLLPNGPATEPGGALLLPALALQRLAATLALDTGDLPLAQDWLAAHDRWLAWSGTVPGQAEGALRWAAYHRAAGDLATARAHAERGLAHARDPRQPLALLAAHRLRGELDTADRRHTDAAEHLDAALALAEACAAPYERALTLLALAELRAAEGKLAEGAANLEDARALLVPLEARPALARADALAQRLATSSATAPATLPFGLTAREVDVLRLLAEELTDPQIAERLFVSRSTVATHTRAIFGKLGVSTRTAAARTAAAHGLA